MGKAETFIRSTSVVARVVAGETLIVPVRAKVGDLASIYNFNGTGTLIWKLLESPRSVAELAASVVEEYDVDLAQAEPQRSARHREDIFGLVCGKGLFAAEPPPV